MAERAVLDRARAGDDRAFGELVTPYTAELRVHCYRLLGSVSDAEDALQEILVAAWRGLPGFEGRSSWRTWLYRVATHHCLNRLRDARRRPRTVPVPPFVPPDPTGHTDLGWLEPWPDAWLAGTDTAGPEARYQSQQAVELTFVEMLRRMPPRQAAALVLRDVLGFSLAEVAVMLDASAVAVKGALARARGAAAAAPVRRPAADEVGISRRFAAAFVADDIDGVVALLTDDAWLCMPPAPHRYDGPAAIAGFLRASVTYRAGRRFDLVATRANGQPAYGCYLDGVPAGLVVLDLSGDRVAGLTRFLSGYRAADFELPG